MEKICIWCFKNQNETTFLKKAHTIPKSLGGQNFNTQVCDQCNEYFGKTHPNMQYSIESALKETFCISKQRFMSGYIVKRKVGEFKSKFFDVKSRNGKLRLTTKPSFKFDNQFLLTFCRNFKRGLVKLWFEEYHRQHHNRYAYESKYQLLRDYSRYDYGDIPVFYFIRRVGIFMMMKKEAETPVLLLNRMKYIYEDDKFTEIEFLGHVFGFPTTKVSADEISKYLSDSMAIKQQYFESYTDIVKLTDIDFTLSIIDRD